MNSPIRKIAIGPDYKNSMHYEVGKPCINFTHEIKRITQVSSNEFTVEIIQDNEVKLWKRIINQPVHIEYMIVE